MFGYLSNLNVVIKAFILPSHVIAISEAYELQIYNLILKDA